MNTLGSVWDENLARAYIESNHLFDQDMSRIFFSNYPSYDMKIFISLHADDKDSVLRENLYSGIKTQEEGEWMLEQFNDLLREKSHPYHYDMENYLKPASLLELKYLLTAIGGGASKQLVSGPDNLLDMTYQISNVEFVTPLGRYVAPIFDDRFLRTQQQGPVFFPHDYPDTQFLVGDELFAYALEDPLLCRAFSVERQRFPESIAKGLEIMETENQRQIKIFDRLREIEPWNPQVREPMPAFVGPSGYIPYTGFDSAIITKHTLNVVYNAFQHAGFELTEDLRKHLWTQAKEGLLDSYEVGAVAASKDLDLLNAMIARNAVFYAMKREAIAKEPVGQEFEFDGLLSNDRLRLEALHDLGFAQREDFKHVHDLTIYIRDTPALMEQRTDRYISELERFRDFHLQSNFLSR